jgi:hypothetical protein
MKLSNPVVIGLFAISGLAFSQQHKVEGFLPESEIFIGVDGTEKYASGAYAGLANPNFKRLTLLYAHQYSDSPESSHYHSKGLFYYSGEATAPKVENSGGTLPEGEGSFLKLLPGQGALSDYLVSGQEKVHFANLTFRPVAWLNRSGAKEWETATYKSGPRFVGSLDKAKVALEVVSLSEGLVVMNGKGSVVADSSGDRIEVGTKNFAFKPIIGVKKGAKPGPYTAEFRLHDLSGNFKDSGAFQIRFQVPTEGSN